MKCDVAILAGGKGTRLSSRTGDLPKPMVPVLGTPLLEYQIKLCRNYGFTNIALLVQHQYEKIKEYFVDGTSLGVKLTYVVENEPRGTAGALHDALPFLSERFLVLYGDTFIDVDLARLWGAHLHSGAAGTLLLHPNDHPQDSDLVDIDATGAIRSIHAYPHPAGVDIRNLVNAALYVLERKGLDTFTPEVGKSDIAKDMFPRMLQADAHLYGYVTPEYIKDMGTPERLDKVELDFVNGLPDRLSSRQLRSAVFLDRDGTLIEEVNYLKTPEQLKLLPGAAEAVRRLNRNGVLAVVATNQPVIARGDITHDELGFIHSRLETKLGLAGAYVDSIYVCPHHPESGFPGEVAELKVNCHCRKPEPGLIEKACQALNIDRRNSWMVGDTTSDVEAGRRAGLRTILVRTGYAGADAKYSVRPDYTCNELSDSVEWVLGGHAELSRCMANIAVAASHSSRLVLIGGLARSGKSFSAQVLKELLHAFGKVSHIVSLDGWLKPSSQRAEGIGVCERYDLNHASASFLQAFRSDKRVTIEEALYNRVNRTIGELKITHSIGPKDILIVEGVPALLMKDLVNLDNVVKVFVDVDSETRGVRLAKDYASRGYTSSRYKTVLAEREADEVPLVIGSRNIADFVVSCR